MTTPPSLPLPLVPRVRGRCRTARSVCDTGKAIRPIADDEILLAVFLKHDQSKNLAEINARLDEAGFWKRFPPEGIGVASWYVMMGIGQVATLRVPASRLREVNLASEQSAWGGFSTEFYPTQDSRPGWEASRRA